MNEKKVRSWFDFHSNSHIEYAFNLIFEKELKEVLVGKVQNDNEYHTHTHIQIYCHKDEKTIENLILFRDNIEPYLHNEL